MLRLFLQLTWDAKGILMRYAWYRAKRENKVGSIIVRDRKKERGQSCLLQPLDLSCVGTVVAASWYQQSLWQHAQQNVNIDIVSTGCKKKETSKEASLDAKTVIMKTSCFFKDCSDEHDIAKYPLIDTELTYWFTFSAAWDFTEPVSYRFPMNSDSWRMVFYNQVPSIIITFHYPSWNLRCKNGSSISTKIKFHHSYNVLIISRMKQDHRLDLHQISWSGHIRIEDQ